jgi:hypothetical protein
MAKFAKFRTVLAAMQALPNVSVRFSSDSVFGEFDERHGFVIVPDPESVPAGVKLVRGLPARREMQRMPGLLQHKSVAVIAYPAHGRKMDKVIQDRTGSVNTT